MTPWEQEAERRRQLIESIFYQELGRLGVPESEMKTWLQQAQNLNNDGKLRSSIREAAGLEAGDANELMQDHEYSSYLRKAQFDESSIQSQLQSAQENIAARIAANRGQYDTQREQQAQNVNRGFESRGMFRSGGRLKKLNEGRSAIDLNQRRAEDEATRQKADLERD